MPRDLTRECQLQPIRIQQNLKIGYHDTIMMTIIVITIIEAESTQ